MKSWIVSGEIYSVKYKKNKGEYKMTNKKELAVLKDYAIANTDLEGFMESMRENFAGEQLNEGDLQRIKMPAGAGGTFEVPSLDGEEYEKEITGTIIHQKNQNVYWAEEFNGEKNPPDCSSKDGKIGVGEPGGECSSCPFNEFGSAMGGDGKACKNLKTLFILREDNLLPLVISLPPTSKKNAKSYLLKLASKGKIYYKVTSKLSLEKAKSKGGIDYMKVKMSYVDELNDKDVEMLQGYRKAILPVLDDFAVTEEAYEVGQE